MGRPLLSRPKYLHTVKCAIGWGTEEWGVAKRTSLVSAYFRLEQVGGCYELRAAGHLQ
jgi:hypothetical protein